MESVIQYFNKYLPLDQNEIDAFLPKLTVRKIKKRQFILQEGDICKNFTYVKEGCFKMYGMDKLGVEHNLVFTVENDWIADVGSLHKEVPSKLYIEAVEPSLVLQISKENLWYLYTHFPKFDRNFRVIIEDKYIDLQNRLFQTFSNSAHERYLEFTNQYPNLLQRLPNTQIASYLGITPEFLSKIRNERKNN